MAQTSKSHYWYIIKQGTENPTSLSHRLIRLHIKGHDANVRLNWSLSQCPTAAQPSIRLLRAPSSGACTVEALSHVFSTFFFHTTQCLLIWVQEAAETQQILRCD